MRHETEHKSFGEPDEMREFPNGTAEILAIGEGQVSAASVISRLVHTMGGEDGTVEDVAETARPGST